MKSGEPNAVLRMPTLNERVTLYLQALYGQRNFSSEERFQARSAILNRMARDIADRFGELSQQERLEQLLSRHFDELSHNNLTRASSSAHLPRRSQKSARWIIASVLRGKP
jgi:hypothetical protein